MVCGDGTRAVRIARSRTNLEISALCSRRVAGAIGARVGRWKDHSSGFFPRHGFLRQCRAFVDLARSADGIGRSFEIGMGRRVYLAGRGRGRSLRFARRWTELGEGASGAARSAGAGIAAPAGSVAGGGGVQGFVCVERRRAIVVTGEEQERSQYGAERG